VDVLTDLLARSRARGAGFAHTVVRGAGGVRFPPGPGLAVHVMVDGEAFLTSDGPEGPEGAAPVRLVAGDLVLVRGTVTHALASGVGAPCRELVDLLAEGPVAGSSRAYAVGPDEGPTTAVFFCGAYLFDGDLCDGLLAALPDTVVLRPAAGGALRATADLLGREVLGRDGDEDPPGQQALLDRLLDVALVQVLRQHFADVGPAAPAWFRASTDAGLGAALRALHADPAAPWTVASLAGEAALSRGAFARRFRDRLGVAPLEYLTDWRMALARERLRDSDDGLAAVGAAVGYRSEFAFAAAFKRHHGTPPGRWRTDARLAARGH
jgi:AraC-like DNA-binding protein